MGSKGVSCQLVCSAPEMGQSQRLGAILSSGRTVKSMMNHTLTHTNSEVQKLQNKARHRILSDCRRLYTLIYVHMSKDLYLCRCRPFLPPQIVWVGNVGRVCFDF